MLMQGTEAKTTPKPATDAPSTEGAEAIDSTIRDAATSVERQVMDWVGHASDWLDGRPIASHLAGIGVLLAAAAIALLLVRFVVGPVLRRVSGRFGHASLSHIVTGRTIASAAWSVAAMVAWGLTPTLTWLSEPVRQLVENLAGALFAILAARLISGVVGGAHSYYRTNQGSNHRSITSFVQLGQLLVWIVGAIFAISLLLDRSPALLLSGLGAAAAIIILVFRDTLLSLVAAIQVSTNDLVRVGDWISSPKFGADGYVLDIGLNVVNVQNFDKTITSIPTFKLIDEAFTNWRGMTESGGRRIKRSLLVDVQTVRFLREDEASDLARMSLIAEYMREKLDEIAKANDQAAREAAAATPPLEPQERRLTNLGTFRAYIERYLQARADVRKDMTLLVRHLDPTIDGLPIQVYCFTATTNWNAYESIQADIFDHLLATAPRFGLRIVQRPTGEDVAAAGPREAAAAAG
jgi:miniconductance mechanosensitive channel